jgi:lipid-binding SYLF domain-containing protein
MKRVVALVVVVVVLVFSAFIGEASADSAAVLETKSRATVKMFEETKGSGKVLDEAKGLLIFPSVKKIGMGLGAEYGEGVLLVDDKRVNCYNTIAGSVGLQLGVQAKSIILAFMTDQALENFQNASGWKIGFDASVAVIVVGAGGSIDSAVTNKPIIAFVFDQKGLMYNLTLEGAKISKIKKK